MLKNTLLYIQHQSGYLSLLFLLFVIPLGLFFQFSTYPLPKVQYVILGCLFASQYAFYNEKAYRRKVEPENVLQLQNELKRVPSIKEIHKRVSHIVFCRNMSIFIAGFSILLLMTYFKQF